MEPTSSGFLKTDYLFGFMVLLDEKPFGYVAFDDDYRQSNFAWKVSSSVFDALDRQEFDEAIEALERYRESWIDMVRRRCIVDYPNLRITFNIVTFRKTVIYNQGIQTSMHMELLGP